MKTYDENGGVIRSFASLPMALVRPDAAFARREIYRVPKALIIALLFVAWIAGERMEQGYYQNEHAKTLSILEGESRLDSLMENAPPQAQRQARDQMIASIIGDRSGITTAISIVFSGVGFLLVLAEMWLVSLIASQFFGGQEDRRGRERPSQTLFLVSFVPLALRRLLAGILMSLRSPEAASNALTLAEYRNLSEVRFDFYSLLFPGSGATFLTILARILTDPFFLWALAILWFGGREAFHIGLRAAVLLSLVLVAVACLQFTLLARIGVTGGI